MSSFPRRFLVVALSRVVHVQWYVAPSQRLVPQILSCAFFPPPFPANPPETLFAPASIPHFICACMIGSNGPYHGSFPLYLALIRRLFPTRPSRVPVHVPFLSGLRQEGGGLHGPGSSPLCFKYLLSPGGCSVIHVSLRPPMCMLRSAT